MGDHSESKVILPSRFKKLLRHTYGLDKNRNAFYTVDPFNTILPTDRCKDCLVDHHKEPIRLYNEQFLGEEKCSFDNRRYATSSPKTDIQEISEECNQLNSDSCKDNIVYLKSKKVGQKGVDLDNQKRVANHRCNQHWKSIDMTKTNIDNSKNVQDLCCGDKQIDKGQGICTVAEIFQALGWIREQILQMKEEDKMLMQQFLDLSARIRNLKSHIATIPSYSFGHPYNSEISVSHLGIDEACEKAYPVDLNLSPNQEEDYLGEFRERTVSMHLVKPKKKLTVATKTIRKYRTEEYL